MLLAFAMASVAAAKENGASYAIGVDGLACPFCGYGVEKQLMRIEGVTAVEIDLEKGTVTTTLMPGHKMDKATAQKAVEAAGFTLRNFRELVPSNR